MYYKNVIIEKFIFAKNTLQNDIVTSIFGVLVFFCMQIKTHIEHAF